MKLIVANLLIIGAIVLPAIAKEQYISNAEIGDIVKAHNDFRSKVNPPASNMKTRVIATIIIIIARAIISYSYYTRCIIVIICNFLKLIKAYDKDLAEIAQNYAEECIWSHNGERSNEAGRYVGENLYLTSRHRENINFKVVVGSWYSEVKDYTYKDSSCAKGKACGHYTQVSDRNG